MSGVNAMPKDHLLQDLKTHFESLGSVRNLAQKYDQVLLEYLLQTSEYREEFKSRFFIQTSQALIFKLNDFLSFLDLRNLGGSYTSYVSKIGLASKTKFLKANNEVVLNFAFKDGVIKGCQSKDEQKLQEIFFNEILAKDEIDVLFTPKALHNFQACGEQDLQAQLSSSPNLLLKGNNLLALHSIKRKYAKQVKLIYIDPPYNTGNDSFNYNDRFNHSTWLTFIKNRLEVAREFLRDDGVIFVQCDDNEQAYLKVLMDEIFGRENFVGCLIHQRASGGGIAKFFVKGHDYILCFAKDISNASALIRPKKVRGKVINKDGKDFFVNDDVVRKVYGKYNGVGDRRCFYEELSKWKNEKQILEIEEKLKSGEFTLKKHSSGNHLICRLESLDEGSKLYSILSAFSAEGKKEMEILGIPFSFPKPENLLQQLIFATTNENDLILDFFAGSGTTLAVAHKMNRRWIGIEQMDYIESITKERLKKVIDGEQGGVSKACEWKGGGGFVYAELMPLNKIYKDEIKRVDSETRLAEIYADLESKAFLDYRIDLQEILKDQDFKDLDVENKKQVLKLILDSNMDYLPYGEIKDETYQVSKEIIKLNEIFYGGKR